MDTMWMQRLVVESLVHVLGTIRGCYLQDNQAARAQRLAAGAQRGSGRPIVQRVRKCAQRKERQVRLCAALHAVQQSASIHQHMKLYF